MYESLESYPPGYRPKGPGYDQAFSAGQYSYPQHGYYAPAALRPDPDRYTPWINRVGAFLIDQVPVWIVTFLCWGIGWAAFGAALLGATESMECTTDEYGSAYCASDGGAGFLTIGTLALLAGIGLATLLAAAFVIWNNGYRQGRTGQSIGKSILKFKVISERTGQPVGFGASVVRQLAHAVDGLICYVGYLFPIWDDKRQTLADKIMTTVCVPADQTSVSSRSHVPRQRQL